MIQKCKIQREIAKKNRRPMAVLGVSCGFAAVQSQFLNNAIKATAVTHFMAEFNVGFNGFKK